MKFLKKIFIIFSLTLIAGFHSFASFLLIPMDDDQKNHLKAYGIAYWTIQNKVEVQWLLNYRGGSFLIQYVQDVEQECVIRGVSYEIIADVQAQVILNEIAQPEVNMDVVKLEKAPKIAVYTPSDKRPWDDAVTLVMTYAEIPYDKIYDPDILEGKLANYDWLHLHHEDFTGQYGKFYSAYRYAAWYVEQQKQMEELAKKFGFNKVSQLKLFVAKSIKEYVNSGGFLFTMCSGTDSYDIALAAENTDICESPFDGDPCHPQCQQMLDYSKTFAFHNFKLIIDPNRYEYSDIDATESRARKIRKEDDYFTLFDFSAKWDPIPTMLCQNHRNMIKGFMGQTTSFNKDLIKPNVIIMGENKAASEARYIHGTFGKGTWTFYGGHDPEDYQHFVGDPPTDLNLHPNSPGYRLILNNVLFPAAKKKKLKT
ncbi:MAG: asparagine synthetase B [Bacteroidetes bacterium RIFOXYA12_FULL_35_11]|nr:MAG: asparagine synthetase B [Bacteroidetes bacterium GWF2_35_48]OFY72688.1 MAG: asparagine synthetase B [Bacteroidetes bacterium RIFOXYA12_FULL_35_11]OFZ04508.1 MAG: asparagine synthetase B [Bacteroidetes bacterium RIFOXYC12_FULL_35_7]HBX50999.1 asparagine synthetase B [Bacteroidales bacterium]